TVEISDIAEFKRKYRAVDLPVVERKAGVAKDSHCPKKCTATTVLEGQLTIFIPAPNGHKFVVLEQGETGIFIDYEAGKPNETSDKMVESLRQVTSSLTLLHPTGRSRYCPKAARWLRPQCRPRLLADASCRSEADEQTEPPGGRAIRRPSIS